jgi:hypothetical protein
MVREKSTATAPTAAEVKAANAKPWLRFQVIGY